MKKKLLFCLIFLCISEVCLPAQAGAPFQIRVVDEASGWPVPLVQLRTTHHLTWVSDNDGMIAIDAPELMDSETWFSIEGHGYGVAADGFGMKGTRLTPQPGRSAVIQVQRWQPAKRLGRLTGAGLFAESQRLGLHMDWMESGITGCDSVQTAVHNGRHFWAWGDTLVARYPLGLFHMLSATTVLQPLASFEPPLKLRFDYFSDPEGRPRNVAVMPGDGPTWVSGYVSLPDQSGTDRLVGCYVKVKPPLTVYERGLCVWNEGAQSFDHLRTLWTLSETASEPSPAPEGHPSFWRDADGVEWVLFGNPLPTLRCRASFEAWMDPEQWEVLKPQETLAAVNDGKPVKPHSGSIAWNDFRQRWVTVFVQHFGESSFLGEIWYAESSSPYGPWGPAIRVCTHDNYSFYNPRLHPEFTPAGSPILLFEGTYTAEFANKPQPTARYNYNQMLYRLDLDDPEIASALEP
jgi:hypothetical protein